MRRVLADLCGHEEPHRPGLRARRSARASRRGALPGSRPRSRRAGSSSGRRPGPLRTARPRRPCGAVREHAMERRGKGTFGRAQIRVARRQGQAVLLAYGRGADDLSREVEVPRHARDDLELLVILLAEHGDVGQHLRQQLGDHGRDAAEEMRAECVFEADQRRPLGHDPGGKALRVHLLDRRSPHQVDFRLPRALPSRFPGCADKPKSPRAARTGRGLRRSRPPRGRPCAGRAAPAPRGRHGVRPWWERVRSSLPALR